MKFSSYSTGAVLAILACCNDGMAATNFSYQKTIHAGAGGAISNRFTSMVGAPAGGLYVLSSALDRISYMPNPVDDSETSIIVSSDPSYGTGNSLAGVTVTPSGTAYAGGKDTEAVSTYWKAVPDAAPATSFVATQLDSLTGLYSGPAAISNDTFVIGADADGGLVFVQNAVDPGLTVLNPTPIAGGAAGTKSVVYDPVGGKLYAAGSPAGTSGLIHSFTTNGTPAGTAAGTVYFPGVATTLAANEQGLRYQSIAISPTARLLAVAVNSGEAGVNKTGWAIFSLISNTQIDFITLGPDDVPGGTELNSGTGTLGINQAQGCAFVEKNGSTYLILSTGNNNAVVATRSRAYVFKQNLANVVDWTVY